jgi:N-hydroxyarylamine O-acetyltransferase
VSLSRPTSSKTLVSPLDSEMILQNYLNQAYLNRIDYRGKLETTAVSLRQLQFAHLVTVPFENLSIHTGEPIVLETAALFDKIVRRRRGGFCYEANGLFAALLRALGFEVSLLAAGVARGDGSFGPPFDHMALLVELEERWLVDVGFGDSFLRPLRLDEPGEQIQGRRAYRIIPHKSGHPSGHDNQFLLQQRDGTEAPWLPQYRFALHAYDYADYAAMCHYHQTSPDSHFTQGRVCSRATTDGGRLTLRHDRLIITAPDGSKQEQKVENEAEYTAVLQQQFGIKL